MDKDLSSRGNHIFDIIVQAYIETAEPVGSRTISKLPDVGLSSASIRNVMADLEDQGLLAQPHTSAGRVPTDKGYRYWVDRLMKPAELSEEERAWIVEELEKARTIEGMADRVSKIIATLTDNASIIYIKSLKRISFLSQLLDELVRRDTFADFLEEDSELFIEGAFRILEQPEFRDDSERMRTLLRALDEKYEFVRALLSDLEQAGVHVHIGRENTIGRLENVSLVMKDCYYGETPIGGIGVLGPTRMKYPKVVAVVDFVANTMTRAVNRF